MCPKQKRCPPRTPISCHLIAPTSDDSIHIVGTKFIAPAPLKRPILDAEALRIVKALPNFIPGTENGKPVGVTFTLPISFKAK
jgi:hypothetical protein